MSKYKINQDVVLKSTKEKCKIKATVKYFGIEKKYKLDNGLEVFAKDIITLKEFEAIDNLKVPKMNIDNLDKTETSIEQESKAVEKLTKKKNNRSGKNSDIKESDK